MTDSEANENKSFHSSQEKGAWKQHEKEIIFIGQHTSFWSDIHKLDKQELMEFAKYCFLAGRKSVLVDAREFTKDRRDTLIHISELSEIINGKFTWKVLDGKK